MATVQVSELWRYPVKSCKGFQSELVHVDARGIIGDRRYLVINEHGRFMTQREYPAMALIEPHETGTGLILNAPGKEPLEVQGTQNGERLTVTIWDDTVEAVTQDPGAAAWLSDYFGAPMQLVQMAAEFSRRVDPYYAVHPSDETSFADGYPLLLISEASLTALNDRLVARGAEPVPMNRFRPNIVVSGCEAFAEDSWKQIRIGTTIFHLVKPCARCIMTTIDQTTGVKALEPIPTLKTFRKNADGTKVLFGQNLIHSINPGQEHRIHVGNTVEIVQ